MRDLRCRLEEEEDLKVGKTWPTADQQLREAETPLDIPAHMCSTIMTYTFTEAVMSQQARPHQSHYRSQIPFKI